ncbi:hypothetical protein PoB_001780600 [Plakobranchus ocellatus]|uniref:Uncharacterized protein n=1 Tax=Plakobranchus ocellatus TaxID=259542 RepID=A0AAV3Z9G6_9GAST|nr:hypothetical protein PoB_001780600 [Plakobranchus ocellatus]
MGKMQVFLVVLCVALVASTTLAGPAAPEQGMDKAFQKRSILLSGLAGIGVYKPSVRPNSHSGARTRDRRVPAVLSYPLCYRRSRFRYLKQSKTEQKAFDSPSTKFCLGPEPILTLSLIRLAGSTLDAVSLLSPNWPGAGKEASIISDFETV